MGVTVTTWHPLRVVRSGFSVGKVGNLAGFGEDMNDHITLLGAEQVSTAGHNMGAAAERMVYAVSAIDETMNRFLSRFEELVVRLENLAETPK